jgi:hypothetical protein
MRRGRLVPWTGQGWKGWIDPAAGLDVAACLTAAATGAGRRSRHARTARVETAGGAVWVKAYPPPGGARAVRAWRMGEALARAGFGAPDVLLVARAGAGGLLVTRDAGGEDLRAAVAARHGAAKRALLAALGAEVGRLHQARFVHGDLVPPNVRVVEDRFCFLDNDRTRRSGVLVRLGARRNLVQLGRFIVPGVTLSDRARVLAAYAATRRLSRRGRHRLAAWLVVKTTARRCTIDGIAPAAAAGAGFRALMRAGGPFDTAAPARREPA